MAYFPLKLSNFQMALLQQLRTKLFGANQSAALSERIQREISVQQLSSERLIGWVQFGVVVLLGLLYLISPKTFQHTAFAPVPWALSIYLVFVIVRLSLAYLSKLPRWFLALSVVADMSLLMILIWSFHIQYKQPAAFYLKAPTLLYVFVFIALRALRFDVFYVLLAGIVASLGWLALTFIAIFTSPTNPITRNYVDYLTSNHVLLGAEFDKIISILLTTTILAVAIVRAKRLLERAVTEGQAAQELSRFFAPEVATTIKTSAEKITAGQGKLRDAAILHCDVRGFTSLAMHTSPSELMQILADYQARMVKVLHAHHGSVDKFLGDGILASFGAAKETKTYAADALRAVHAMAKEGQVWAKERAARGTKTLRIGVTVAVGPVIFGAVGDESRLEYTVIGDAVNLAAKLDKQCKVENCTGLTTQASYTIAVEQGYKPISEIEHRPQRNVSGVEHPLDLVIVEK